MKRFLILNIVLTFIAIILAQNLLCQNSAPVCVTWSQCYGGYEDDDIFTAKATPDSGIIMGGLSQSSEDDLHKNNGDYDWWILKIDQNRDTVYSVSYGGSKYDKCRYAIGNKEDGSSMAFGSLHSLKDGDIDTSQIVGTADSGWWLLKLDENGKMVYQKLYNGEGLHGGRSMLQTDVGYLLCGWSTSTTNIFAGNYGSYDTYLMNVDKDGNTQWVKNYGGSGSDRCRSVIKTLDGGYAFNGGSYSNDSDFTAQNHGQRDVMVVKVDSLGNTIWKKLYGGAGMEHAFGLALDWDGNFLVAGEDSAASGDCNNVHGQYDGWILKINQANGDTLWTLNLGDSGYQTAMRFLPLPDKGYIALLSSSSSGNSSDKIDSTTSTLGHGDIWLMRLDSNRNTIWSKQFGGSWGETANDIQIFDTGYMVWGLTASSDGDVLGHHSAKKNDTNKDVWAFFVVDSTLFKADTTASIKNPFAHENFNFTILPSPNNGKFSVQIKLLKKQDLEMEISNVIGQSIEKLKLTYSGEKLNQKIDLSHYKNGIYNITIRNTYQQLTKKVVIQN